MAKKIYDIDEEEVGKIITFQATVSYFVSKIMSYLMSQKNLDIDEFKILLMNVRKVSFQQFNSDEKEDNEQLYKDSLQSVLSKIKPYDDFSNHCQILEEQISMNFEQTELIGENG